jgi:hypothetical protein
MRISTESRYRELPLHWIPGETALAKFMATLKAADPATMKRKRD